MIARRDQCNPDLLAELLHARLTQADELSITTHLDDCAACRRKLDQLTAPDGWWFDTQRTLKDSYALSRSVEPNLCPPIDNAVAWVVNLLKPANDKHSIGTLDGRAVREVIGQGGMGVVLKVWDEELHRPLAVKLLSPMLASNGAARQRFFREAQAAAAVVHPNIVPIYTVATEGVLPYLVMPFVAGGNLQQRLDREGPLPISEILSVGVQIAEALVAAHRLGLVHRDIKPANILLDEGGHRVLLSDFGLARTIDDASLTNSGMVAGTPQYMSPEQARGAAIDHRSDLYSLGAVLYAMATGRPPVRGDSTLAILRLVGEEKPVPIYDVNETIPIWFDRLVNCFLAKQADERIGNAESAAELLRTALAHSRSPAHNPLPRKLHLRGRARSTWLAATLGLLFLMVPILYVALNAFETQLAPSSLNQSVQQATPWNNNIPGSHIPGSQSSETSIDSEVLNLVQRIGLELADLQQSIEAECRGLSIQGERPATTIENRE